MGLLRLLLANRLILGHLVLLVNLFVVLLHGVLLEGHTVDSSLSLWYLLLRLILNILLLLDRLLVLVRLVLTLGDLLLATHGRQVISVVHLLLLEVELLDHLLVVLSLRSFDGVLLGRLLWDFLFF